MRECICCQCAEVAGEFKGYLQCSSCDLFGNEDEFSNDDSGVCNNCNEKEIKND